MRIGLIGAGRIGATLAEKFVATGHVALLANSRGSDSLGEKAENIGAIPASVQDAVKGIDVVVPSIPMGSIP